MAPDDGRNGAPPDLAAPERGVAALGAEGSGINQPFHLRVKHDDVGRRPLGEGTDGLPEDPRRHRAHALHQLRQGQES